MINKTEHALQVIPPKAMGCAMKKKATIPLAPDHAQPYVMGIADQLSDDPMLRSLIGSRFKVVVNYDAEARRVTYSFRAPEDFDPNDSDAVPT
ncbi:hypothetical protein [Hydrogenophaga sp. PAMC20947]|uniref:hypothetical protein n=1 Tax=Hydrogenophaga sp. PAMC20947 TaxID=2565558 RepID=UPI00109E2EC2|nr:hypothetical protein [Hydrogenophaga sp. PAMC20947]QCB46431.1 hypothetical protein E5678_10595 [Hydrogenophaga sp. PAMC20947]